jgi:hypothetical protein
MKRFARKARPFYDFILRFFTSNIFEFQMNVHIRSRPFKCRLEGCDADFNELANR